MLGQVMVEDVRARHRGHVGAGPGDKPVGQARVGAAVRLGDKLDVRIAGGDALLGDMPRAEGLEFLAQPRDMRVINLANRLGGGLGFLECTGLELFGAFTHRTIIADFMIIFKGVGNCCG